jgi:PAS domain S-box-containing protein
VLPKPDKLIRYRQGQTEARGLLRALRYAMDRKSLEDDLFLEKERALVTLNSIGDAVACTDNNGNLTFLNRVGEKLTGWSWSEASGRPMAEVFRILDDSDRDATSSAIATTIGGDGLSNLISRSVLVRRDGYETPIEDSVAPINGRDGLAIGAVVVLRDVSASRALARHLARSAAEMAHSAAKLARQNKQINRVNDELAAIVRSSPIAIFAMDPEGVVTMWSPAAERLSGFSAQQAIGVFLPIVPEKSVEEFRDRVRSVSEGDAASNVELNGQKKDGAMIELSLSMAALTDEGGVARGAICLAENVTEAVAERRRIARIQNGFVATVSHELRTPLTSIGGSLALIAGGAVGSIGERPARLVELASRNTQRLIRLVNDILDVEKLQTGKMLFRFEEVNLDDIVEEAIAANAAYAENLGVEIRRLGEASNVIIRADVDRANQAITNILSNAAKFSPPNSRIEIFTERTDRGARVTVIDRGPGISEEFRTRIFEPFAQADNSDQRTKDGSGLGLSIVRKIMERHGGTVAFDDNPGGGTSFHLDFHTLPARDAAAA